MKTTYEEASRILTFEDSYSRLAVLLRLSLEMQRHEWLKLLGEEWQGCDNIGPFRLALRKALGTVGPIIEMMDNKERVAFDALPATVTIYRGCGPSNALGASWSTKRSVAEKFPFLARFRAKNPMLVTAKVKKGNILAYKLDRNEYEVITFSARRTSVEPLLLNPFEAS